ncbi:hypothetical protein HUG15_15415 [Salicibibacter cibarius]|uniref:Uncharacterized protein n=1 Tax=Salicibibacter cibarius TaxID=2743000 RepID=A0A7T6Z4Z4_9BACI|nr:hypothetical protein [Salicibibacter cibarius]QQK76812.1 hypothetical protein HUG15_15415 [Salicibibacter cibarius]
MKSKVSVMVAVLVIAAITLFAIFNNSHFINEEDETDHLVSEIEEEDPQSWCSWIYRFNCQHSVFDWINSGINYRFMRSRFFNKRSAILE